MKKGNLTSNLSIYLLGSQAILAVMVIIVGYWFAKKIVYENLFHKLRYHMETAFSPIRNSMQLTQWQIDNCTINNNSGFLKSPLHYAEQVFKTNPSIEALRVVIQSKYPGQKSREYNYYRHNNVVKEGKAALYRDFPLAGKWMDNNVQTDSAEWSVPFYRNQASGSYEEIIVYSRPVVLDSVNKEIRGNIYCAISIDKDLVSFGSDNEFKDCVPLLISEKGVLIYPPDSIHKFNSDPGLAPLFNKLDFRKTIEEKKEGSLIVYPAMMKMKKSIAVYWPISSADSKMNWVMVTILPVKTFMHDLNKIVFYAILIIMVIGSISTALAIYLSHKLVSPITTLAHASKIIIEEEGGKNYIPANELEVLSQSIEILKRKLRRFEKERLKSDMDNEELERELNLAKEIEMGIVPNKFPLFPGRKDFDCFGKLIPAKIVGGDLFDFFLLDENNLFVSICDTLGKGIPAAMFAVATRTLIRSVANPITRVGKMMELLNDELSLGHESDMYVTVMMGRLNLDNGEFAYCNAGHPRPVILRNSGKIEEIETTHGFPVGVRKNQKYIETIVRLKPGETILAYTDGITEEIDKYGNLYGKERLYSVVQMHMPESPERIIKEVLKNLDRFRGKSEIYDDTTILAVKYFGKAGTVS